MAPGIAEEAATLTSDELSFVRRCFKNGDVKSDGRISVAEVLACLEQMHYILDGTAEDLVRSVVPGAARVDRLSLNDAIKVAAAAKAQDQGSGAPEAPGIGREDSLAELESSFNRQVMSGALVADVIEESRTPSVGLSREDSLAQLESSFHRQVISGDIPTAIVEAPQSVEGGPPPGIMPPLKLDIPQRRRSIAGVYPAAPPSPRTTAPSLASRRASLPANQGAEPVVVDSLPKRRSSVARPGGGSLVGLQAWSGSNTGSSGMLDDEDDSTTLPASPELLKQSSEMELLETAGTLGVEPVELESGPKKRRSFAVSQSWLEAAAQERHPLEGATVSYEDVDERDGRSWWQCVLCVPSDLLPADDTSAMSSVQQEEENSLDDYDALAAHIKPELWSKSSQKSVSSSSIERPGKGDVCSIM